MKNILFRRTATLVTLLFIAGTMLSSVNAVSEFYNPITVNDPLSIGGHGDVTSVSVGDNGTYLIIRVVFDNISYPMTLSYIVKHSVLIYIDTDMNPNTGGMRQIEYESFPIGMERFVYAYVDSLGYKLVRIHSYSADGTQTGLVSNSSWIQVNGSDIIISLPFTELGISNGSLIRVLVAPMVDFRDKLPTSHYTNVTVNYTAVTVDGDGGEWNLSNSTLEVDDNDSGRVEYPGTNFTGLYVASDDDYLYFLMKLDTPPNDTFFQAGSSDNIYYRVPHVLTLELDVDNDGTNDYFIAFYRQYNTLSVRNLTDNSISYYSYPGVWNTTDVELALNLSYIGLTNIVGQNITIMVHYLYSEVKDYPVDPSLYYGFVYEVGRGGHFAPAVNNYCPWHIGCVVFNGTIISAGDLNLSFTISSASNSISVNEFNVSPVARGNYLPVVSKYYKFFVYNTGTIIWPIRASIKYNESVLTSLGYGEDELKVYYFNASSKRFEILPASEYSIDTVNNIVYFNISSGVYGAGDPIIILGGSPPVGGDLILYRGSNNMLPLTMIMIGGVALAASTGYMLYKRSRK